MFLSDYANKSSNITLLYAIGFGGISIDRFQQAILSKYEEIKPNDWLKNPLEWKPIQWHFWGVLFTDMSIGYGEYFRSFASNLKEYLRKDSLYLICGNKDDLIAMLLFLCKNNILPRTEENYVLSLNL